jgi:DNA-binding NtrC family response regulator
MDTDKKKKIRVLIVDDEERFRTTMTATLNKRGLDVKAVPGGTEALAEIRKGEVDVVVLDVKMPGMDGNEALQKIKMLKEELPVIMLTGHGTMDSALAGWRDAAYAYLMKPLDADALVEKIVDAYADKKGIDKALWHSVWTHDTAID